MEQTLGKRIAMHRKQQGLTQDQLAEKLGITAQAVSKWENDQSCPDISTLPQLARIFGITTDELLGSKAETVHEAEVVTRSGQEGDEGIHIHWDSGRSQGLFFALCVLWVGGLTLLARIMEWDISFWQIVWPSAILFAGVGGVRRRFSVFSFACILFGGYFLASYFGLITFHITGKLIFPICILLFGVGLLIDALHKPKKPRLHISRGRGNKKTAQDYRAEDGEFECTISFGERSQEVMLPMLEQGRISGSFGELTMDLSGCEAVAEDCYVEANCSFGELCLLVPRRYKVAASNSTTFASIEVQGEPDSAVQGIIRLDANANFGEIVIRYV